MTRDKKRMVKDIKRMIRKLNKNMWQYPSKRFMFRFIDRYATKVVLNNRNSYQLLSVKDIYGYKKQIEFVVKDNNVPKKYTIYPGLFESLGIAEYAVDTFDRLFFSKEEYDTFRFNIVLRALLMTVKDKLEGRYV